MIPGNLKAALAVHLVLALAAAGIANAQNPVQWSGSVDQSVARSAEQSMPMLFWVSGDGDDDDGDLEDAQEECFRDPVVVKIIHERFVPVRVSRNSRVIEKASQLGLPTEHGLYCAVLTADGRLLDRMGPAEVANPTAFAHHLMTASTAYLDDLYERELRPILENPEAPKGQVRLAAQTAWRLGIRKADGAIIGLLDREDLTASERSRLYGALASLGTRASVAAILDRAAEDKAAATALMRAEPGALEWIVPDLPGEEGVVTPRQIAAYRATVQICRLSGGKPDAWWETAPGEARRVETERVREKAATVLDYWRRSQPRDE